MAKTMFSQEYDAIRGILGTATFEGAMATVMTDLKQVLAGSGPLVSKAGKLDYLRDVTLKLKEVDRILEGAGMAAGGTAGPDDTAFKRIAAAKFLRHLYIAQARGSQAVWVYSTPAEYEKFPYDELEAAKGSLAQTKTVLGKTAEVFSAETKQRLSEAISMGLKWVMDAQTVLGAVDSDPAAKAKLDRWFAPDAGDAAKVASDLKDGFKKIATLLNDTAVVITDMPSYRKDASKKYTEAFVKSATETPRAIYIEKAMFGNYEISVLHDMKKNWARILVHECTHLEAKTLDKGYAWAGIKPKVKLTPANAAVNADSWAFFAADCGGGLVENEINRALNGTGGGVTELPKNWN